MKESDLQVMVADYLIAEYPGVLFHSDFGSGIKLTIGQAKKQRRQNGGRRAWPDMFIAEPMDHDRGQISWRRYHGLFIELKKEGETLHPGPRAKNRFRSIDGKEYKTEHLQEQADTLFRLRKRSYVAEFAVGFDEAKNLIDRYLGGKYGII